jgi:hypothetical protein
VRWDHGTYEQADASDPPRFRLRGTRNLLFAEMASGIEGVSWTFGGFEQREANLANESSSESAESPRAP